jgi:aconitate hydratase
VPDRATIGNMAPEYGATMGFFPVDTATVDYLRATGRTDAQVDAFETYFKAQGLFGMPVTGQIDYTKTLSLDLSTITPSLAGPKRPQDRIELPKLAARFAELFSKTGADGFSQAPDKLRTRYTTMPMVAGRGAISDAQQQPPRPGMPRDYVEMVNNRPTPDPRVTAIAEASRHRQRRCPDRRDHVVHQHVEPERAACRWPAREKGRREGPEGRAAHQDFARPRVARRHRLPDEDQPAAVSRAARIRRRRVWLHDVHRQCRRPVARDQRRDREPRPRLRGRAVRQSQFRSAHHPNLKANFLASPPLVVAYAIAGSMLKDLTTEPLGEGKDGPSTCATSGRRRTRSVRS